MDVEDAIAKADTLIEAMGWIRSFRGKTTVIKLGGSLLDDVDALHHLLLDVIFMESVGMKPVVVHGGGAAINRAMQDGNIEAKWFIALKTHHLKHHFKDPDKGYGVSSKLWDKIVGTDYK